MYANKAAAMKDDKKQEKDKLIRNTFTLDGTADMECLSFGVGETRNRYHTKKLLSFSG